MTRNAMSSLRTTVIFATSFEAASFEIVSKEAHSGQVGLTVARWVGTRARRGERTRPAAKTDSSSPKKRLGPCSASTAWVQIAPVVR